MRKHGGKIGGLPRVVFFFHSLHFQCESWLLSFLLWKVICVSSIPFIPFSLSSRRLLGDRGLIQISSSRQLLLGRPPPHSTRPHRRGTTGQTGGGSSMG